MVWSEGNNFENEQRKETLESSISSLTNKITKNYNIEFARVPKLVKFSSGKSREQLITELKGEFQNTGEKEHINNTNYEDLANDIQELAELYEQQINQEKLSFRSQREQIISELGKTSELSEPKISEKLFGKEFVEKAQNPKSILDQINGLLVGGVESVALIGKLTGNIALGIVKTPYDLYQVATGKAEYDGIEKI